MIAEIGHFALTLALIVALVQASVPLAGAARGAPRLMALAGGAAQAQFLLVALSFAALMAVHVGSDFSVRNVVENSHTAKPLLYKITGVWGNHEGSMLLWVLMLALFGALIAPARAAIPDTLKARALAVQGMIAAAFLAFVLFAANPFERVFPPPADGNDLNPLLQDPGLAFHPPLLYLGYVGFSITFSFAAAALIEGRVDAAWARAARPYILLAWSALTAGIALGSWWAYYELGWGGYWFWDPVENASLMPWLAGTALLHAAIVLEKREAMRSWTALLAILTFSLSLLGTFLVRSGVVVSVHAFASDPLRGLFILAIMAIAIGGALALFVWRAPRLADGTPFAPLSREGGLLLNNVLLVGLAAAVILGTLAPILFDALDWAPISVGRPYFEMTFVPIAAFLLLFVPVGALMPWRSARIGSVLRKLWPAAAAALLAAALAYALSTQHKLMAGAGMALAVWLLAGSTVEILRRLPGGWRNIPRASWAMIIAHMGLGVLVAGITGVGAWQSETLAALKPGQRIELGAYGLTFESVDAVRGPNYQAMRGTVAVHRGPHLVARLHPERRFYPLSGMTTTEAAIRTTGLGDLYVVLGEPQVQDKFALRASQKPLAPLIWLGALTSAAGAMLSLSTRMRLRRRAKASAERTAIVRGVLP